MALQTLTGRAEPLPSRPPISTLAYTSSVIDATGEKFAWTGRVVTPDYGAKSIRTVSFLLGAVTKAGGSALTVSLQDPSLSANPTQPDETQDQTVAIANADAGFVTNAWYTTGNLSADRAVTHGDLLSVVVEYDGAGRLGVDVVNVRNLSANLLGGASPLPACSLKTASWALVAAVPNIVLGFSDGTFGTLEGALPCSSTGTLTYKQDTGTADEYALSFQVPYPCRASGLWAMMSLAAATSDFEFVLYDGTTAMTGGTVAYEGNHFPGAGETRFVEVSFSQQIELAANTVYRLSAKPTQTTSTVSLMYFDVTTVNHLLLHEGGTGFCLDSRLNLGAWIGAVTTRRPFMGLKISSRDDGAGGGSGITNFWRGLVGR